MAHVRVPAAVKISACLLLAAVSAVFYLAWPHSARRNAEDPRFSLRAGHLYYGGRLFTGVQVRHYDASQIFQELSYVDGLLHGRSHEYAIGHKLTALWKYRAGVKDGPQLGWYEEGPPRFEKNFKQGMLEGWQTEWRLDGKVFRQEKYHDGFETDRKILFQDGAVFTNYTKRDGRFYGLDGGSLCMQRKAEGER